MRDDQYVKLKSLTEKLTDVVLVEADPDSWPGDPAQLALLSREDRGDRYWCKKNAAATLSVLMRVQNLIGVVERRAMEDPAQTTDREDFDAEIRSAEKEAKSILNKLQNRNRAKRD